ncbi:GNAT family N-acetyltransferase [Desulfopila aestuarii]|uniref:Predicted N-acetyltransferase YhbS n=1 Tax=Desulfopila aestuarii DSM 18488 TaxID=1121416 RepID=A0A1M7YKX0_9BACT|nr:N-acetyltransferase [Desulfopila aestuarii]SHO53269.1 Predicted N-acetyltransferase YhbS [Desulfopila aestuarii DSM 18488]
MIIRNEEPSDIDTITEVTKAAFKEYSCSQQTEHLTIHDLRVAGALTISLVSEIGGQVVGHIAISPVTISDGTTDWYGIGPVSVLPEYQGCRIGTALVKSGLALLESMSSNGVVLVGLPTYFNRFGFWNYPQLFHEGIPQEVFVAKSLVDRIPRGAVSFHRAFKQLSIIEKDAIADVIIDYAIAGVKVDLADPAIASLIQKKILTEMPGGKVMMRPSVLAEYDSYFAQVSQFRATEMSRVHKNPILAAIKHGNG